MSRSANQRARRISGGAGRARLSLSSRWPPRLRTVDDADRERHASALELFFDLVFVVAVAELGETLSSHTSAVGFLHFAVVRRPRDPQIWIRLLVALLLAALAVAGRGISAPALTIGVAGLLIAAILASARLSGPKKS
jgi:hypothetical protein